MITLSSTVARADHVSVLCSSRGILEESSMSQEHEQPPSAEYDDWPHDFMRHPRHVDVSEGGGLEFEVTAKSGGNHQQEDGHVNERQH